ERSDFGAAAGDDAADVQGCSPVQTGADRDLVGGQVVAGGDREGGRLQGSYRGDASTRSRRFRAGRFRDEEGGDAVTGVAADEATGVDHALVSRTREPPYQREETRGRKALRQLRRALEIREQDRSRPFSRDRELLHPTEMAQVARGS